MKPNNTHDKPRSIPVAQMDFAKAISVPGIVWGATWKATDELRLDFLPALQVFRVRSGDRVRMVPAAQVQTWVPLDSPRKG